MTTTTTDNQQTTGWELRQFGSPNATETVLLLPGLTCTSAFYDDVVADPRVGDGDKRWIAATPPGFGGLPAPVGFEPSVEGYAQLTADLAAELGCNTIVGHSFFANVGIEMAATGRFSGRLVLLSPTFRAADEESDLRMFNRLARIPGLGRGVWRLVRRIVPMGMKGRFPAERQAALVAEMQKFDPVITRKIARHYFANLAHHGSLVERLCDSGVPAWVVRGDEDEIGLSDEDRQQLEACPTVQMVLVADARHFAMVDQPQAIVDVVDRTT